MKKRIQWILFLAIVCSISVHIGRVSAENRKINLLNYTEWGFYDETDLLPHVDSLTHINYAFLGLSPTGDCTLGDSSRAAGFATLKEENPDLTLLFGIGGEAGSDHFSTVAQDPDLRAVMVASCLDLVRDYAFDGVTIAWQTPTAADGVHLVALLADFRAAMGADEVLVGHFSAENTHYDHLPLADIAPHISFVTVSAYDLQDNAALTNHHAALYPTTDDPRTTYGDSAVQHYLSALPAEKIVLGVPLYGRGWRGVTAGPVGDGRLQSHANGAITLPYDQIHALINEGKLTRYWDAAAQMPYAYDGNMWVSYDDPQSLCAKSLYINSHNLGGIAAWEFGDNLVTESNLVSTINRCLAAPSVISLTTQTIMQPDKLKRVLIVFGTVILLSGFVLLLPFGADDD